MSLEDPRFRDNISAHISDEIDEKELETNGKGLVVKERAVYIPPKIYCTRCAKGIHNISEKDQRCLGSRKKGRSDCQCYCQTHYIGRDGRLRKYGTIDDSFTKEYIPKIDHSKDAEIEALNKKWHEEHGTAPKTVGQPKEVIL